MNTTQKFILLCLIAFSQSSTIPEKPHFLSSIIDEVNSAGTTWQAGHNFAPSVSKDALKRLCGAVLNEEFVKNAPFVTDDFYQDVALNDIPDSFDARTHWPKCKYIGHIRDQGNCGSCWAVSLVSVLSDRFCIATKGIFKDILSSDDLLTCCNECGSGCDGACPCAAWWHLTKHGIVTGGDYGSSQGCKPYSLRPCDHHVNASLPLCTSLPEQSTPSCHSTCTNQKYKRNYWRDSYKVKGYYSVNRTVEAIQREILANGPVQGTFTVFEDFLTYKSGVYQHVAGKKVGGHAVKIIGWGEENNTPYWLVANSWNKHWGSDGLFKIRRIPEGFDGTVFAGIPDLSNY